MNAVAGHRRNNRIAVASALLLTAAAAGGCSSTSSLFGSSSSSSQSGSGSSTLSTLFTGGPAGSNPPTTTTAANNTPDFECPDVNVRTGAATLTIGDKPGGDGSTAMALKYQGSIGRTARECKLNAGIVTMKVGIEGRIVAGPAGGPGQLDVPLRIAVVREGAEPKTVLSKIARVPVTVPADIGGVAFTHIDPEVSFPMPNPAGEIDSYVVYVGFDPEGIPAQKAKPKPKAKAKPRAKG